MSTNTLHRALAAVVLVVTLAVYLITLAPTVVFWDVGEFIAAAKMMQVPHPPGSPLFLLVTRVAMLIPFAADQAVRAHTLSAVFSAFSALFLYLVIVRVLRLVRGNPVSLLDTIAVYGSAVVGTFALAFSTTFWDNAIEAEVYGASMFFLTAVMWLVMRWLERSDLEGNEKYFFLIAYLIGLSLGVHLLALLTIFPVLMLVYFKRYEVTPRTFVRFGIVSVAVFLVVYPGIVKYLPGMMDGEFMGGKSKMISYLPWVIIAAACYGVYASYRRKQRLVHIALVSVVLVFVGYTTYTSVIIRSNANPPMNENDPSNLERLVSYLGREQYGNAPLFMPRRYSQEPHQVGMYSNYTSEWDFLFRYQLNHMFFRYLGWNFIGSAGDEQDSGVSWRKLFGLPFLIGLIGLYYLFRKDWKLGLVYLVMFVILGPVLALYQNQQEPQPRERDYFYAGAFYVYAIWIAVGVTALIDWARSYLTGKGPATAAAGTIVAAALVFVPARMLQVNWHEHDHSGNYVAWDYSYNILQTCEPNAILFTNGDNDTFPLWYLQDVEGIRRDVRIVNLSLINTPWYIKQMKAAPYYPEAKAVPISLSEARISNIQPVIWEPKELDLPVTAEAMARYGADSSVVRDGKIRFLFNNTLQVGNTKAIRIQDILVRDIVFTNQWRFPVYFAVTVAPDSKIGLDDYLWFQGLAWRLEPRKVTRDELGINPQVLEANLYDEPEEFSREPRFGYKFRNIADQGIYFDENATRLMVNYRSAFIRLAMYRANVKNDRDGAIAALDRMEALIPRSKIPMEWALQADLASFYSRMGRMDRFNELATELEEPMRRMIASGQANMNSYYNPYRILLEIYDVRGDHARSLDLLRDLEVQFPNDPGLKARIEMVESMARTRRSLDSLRSEADTASGAGR